MINDGFISLKEKLVSANDYNSNSSFFGIIWLAFVNVFILSCVSFKILHEFILVFTNATTSKNSSKSQRLDLTQKKNKNKKNKTTNN